MYQQSKATKLKEGLQFDLQELEEVPAKEKDNVLNLLKWAGQGFDTRTHIIEPRTGMLLKYQPYRRVCNEEGVFYYRKDDSGIERRYDEGGRLLDLHGQVAAVQAPEVKNDKKVSR